VSAISGKTTWGSGGETCVKAIGQRGGERSLLEGVVVRLFGWVKSVFRKGEYSTGSTMSGLNVGGLFGVQHR